VVSGIHGVEGKLIYISGDTSENQAWISMLVLGDLSFSEKVSRLNLLILSHLHHHPPPQLSIQVSS